MRLVRFDATQTYRRNCHSNKTL